MVLIMVVGREIALLVDIMSSTCLSMLAFGLLITFFFFFWLMRWIINYLPNRIILTL